MKNYLVLFLCPLSDIVHAETKPGETMADAVKEVMRFRPDCSVLTVEELPEIILEVKTND